MGDLGDIWQIDWRIFIAGATAWLAGRNPYGPLGAEFSSGAFAYPPTALPLYALFVPLGPLGFYVWTLLTLAGWWWVARRRCPGQLLLLAWSPIILHLVQGQSTLPSVLIIWAALLAPRRGWLWGAALAVALTKPQVALFPLLYLLWLDRRAPWRWQLLGGLALTTLLLALPATLRSPTIWADWLVGLGSYRERILQLAPWQGPSVALLALAAYLWHRSGYGHWHWWLAAAAFPQTSYYATVALLPAICPRPGPWLVAGAALAGLAQGPMSPVALPWILALHMLAAWMIAGGPRRPPPAVPTAATAPVR